jgi:hypothetical protein
MISDDAGESAGAYRDYAEQKRPDTLGCPLLFHNHARTVRFALVDTPVRSVAPVSHRDLENWLVVDHRHSARAFALTSPEPLVGYPI